jgi:hypothetical protein
MQPTAKANPNEALVFHQTHTSKQAPHEDPKKYREGKPLEQLVPGNGVLQTELSQS